MFQNKSVAIQKYCTDLMTLPNKAPLLANSKQILNVEIVVGFQIVFIHPLVRVSKLKTIHNFWNVDIDRPQ